MYFLDFQIMSYLRIVDHCLSDDCRRAIYTTYIRCVFFCKGASETECCIYERGFPFVSSDPMHRAVWLPRLLSQLSGRGVGPHDQSLSWEAYR